jgi:sec-independent protein translocase protein TatB
MFQIGFLEILVVGVVALIVLGPEKLPGTIRTVSLWIGRLRRSFNSIKSDIEKEIGADEIRRQLRNEEIMEKFRHTQSTVQNSISSIKKEADTIRKNVELEAEAASMTSKSPASSAAPVATSETSAPAAAPSASASATPEAAPAATPADTTKS